MLEADSVRAFFSARFRPKVDLKFEAGHSQPLPSNSGNQSARRSFRRRRQEGPLADGQIVPI